MTKKKVSPYFPKLVDHIDASWMKLKGMHYPFAGRDFANLKTFCRSFQEWGMMALWDAFVASNSDWVRKTGYSIDGFIKCLPWLVDDKFWKVAARNYESQMAVPLPTELFAIVDGLIKTDEMAKGLVKKNGHS